MCVSAVAACSRGANEPHKLDTRPGIGRESRSNRYRPAKPSYVCRFPGSQHIYMCACVVRACLSRLQRNVCATRCIDCRCGGGGGRTGGRSAEEAATPRRSFGELALLSTPRPTFLSVLPLGSSSSFLGTFSTPREEAPFTINSPRCTHSRTARYFLERRAWFK